MPFQRSSETLRRNWIRVRDPRLQTRAAHYICTTALDPPLVARIIRALLKGLEDYTVDERGDVGSWARLTCIKGLGQIVLLFLAESSVEINKWLPSHTYHEIVAGILKQGVERLNNNRVEAGKQLIALLKAPHKSGKEAWVLDAEGLFRDLFVNVQYVAFTRLGRSLYYHAGHGMTS